MDLRRAREVAWKIHMGQSSPFGGGQRVVGDKVSRFVLAYAFA